MSADVVTVRGILSARADELDRLSKSLAQVCRDLEPVENQYRAFVDDHELGLLKRSEDDPNYRLPSAALRLKLAHKAIDTALLGRYMALVSSRARLQQRIRDLKAEVEAQRSILSALKVEMEATQ